LPNATRVREEVTLGGQHAHEVGGDAGGDRSSSAEGVSGESASGSTVSLWLATAPAPDRPALAGDLDVDVCVVGAGIAGLSTAYELALAGRQVVVIDQARVGDGMTGRTTAHFSNAFDDRYFEVERMHGERAARLVAESHTRAIDRAEEIATAEGIDCGLERLDGWLFVPPGEDRGVLEKERDAARRAGLGEVEIEPRAPLEHDTGPALRFPDQMQLHPLEYLAGLARAIERRGGRIHAGTRAMRVEGGASARVECADGPVIRARSIVVATNTPFNDRTVIHTKQAPYQTYVIGVLVPRGSVARALYWDTLDPYHYVRLHSPRGSSLQEVLIVGGEDHKTGQEEHPRERWDRLERWTRAMFPRSGAVVHRWSGEVMEPVDALAFIGRNPLDADNVYVVTGDSGNGMTHGVIAGLLLAELIGGREHPWAELYDPSRRTLRALGEFAKENLNVAARYGEWLKRGDVADASEIPRGEGAIVRHGLGARAVHKDERGVVHELSAVCTHLGCLVGWNSAEKTWDCPCHGSRFDLEGRVIHGPARSDLAKPSHEGERRSTA
jgi:glycine/D-amino acid oxidase-like deaminating enzyme/nitrite reductase/ring-hydroxylating ferredoxin subunit